MFKSTSEIVSTQLGKLSAKKKVSGLPVERTVTRYTVLGVFEMRESDSLEMINEVIESMREQGVADIVLVESGVESYLDEC